jgi:hypothetical protein
VGTQPVGVVFKTEHLSCVMTEWREKADKAFTLKDPFPSWATCGPHSQPLPGTSYVLMGPLMRQRLSPILTSVTLWEPHQGVDWSLGLSVSLDGGVIWPGNPCMGPIWDQGVGSPWWCEFPLPTISAGSRGFRPADESERPQSNQL